LTDLRAKCTAGRKTLFILRLALVRANVQSHVTGSPTTLCLTTPQSLYSCRISARSLFYFQLVWPLAIKTPLIKAKAIIILETIKYREELRREEDEVKAEVIKVEDKAIQVIKEEEMSHVRTIRTKSKGLFK
jgi:hypothetical protein